MAINEEQQSANSQQPSLGCPSWTPHRGVPRLGDFVLVEVVEFYPEGYTLTNVYGIAYGSLWEDGALRVFIRRAVFRSCHSINYPPLAEDLLFAEDAQLVKVPLHNVITVFPLNLFPFEQGAVELNGAECPLCSGNSLGFDGCGGSGPVKLGHSLPVAGMSTVYACGLLNVLKRCSGE